jgi:membrane associated rhomboid family serine protease
MLLPIRDENPIPITPFVNYGIIAACAAVFLWQNGLNERAADLAVYAYGLIPGTLFGKVRVDPAVRQLPGWLTIYTSMFMHGGWLHIIGNMWFLWIFGDNIEAAVGHKRYLFFYLLCGTAAAAAQIFHDPGSEVPMIGASGAISGILGAYFMLQPRSNVKVLVLLIIFFTVVNMPAWIVLGFWFVAQLIGQAGTTPNEPGVAFIAHIGGFIAGAALISIFRRRDVMMFRPPTQRGFSIETRPVRFRRGIPDVDLRRDGRGPWD